MSLRMHASRLSEHNLPWRFEPGKIVINLGVDPADRPPLIFGSAIGGDAKGPNAVGSGQPMLPAL